MKKVLPLIASVLFIASALPCVAFDLCGDADEEACVCGPCACCTPVNVDAKRIEVVVPLTQPSEYPVQNQTVIFSDFTADILRPPCF